LYFSYAIGRFSPLRKQESGTDLLNSANYRAAAL